MNESDHKRYILEKFVPALNMVLLKTASVAFRQYMGSACRQTAIFTAHEMRNRMPEQTWHVFEGTYVGSPRGREQTYDHAWVWSSGGIFIDANHRRAYRIWEEDSPNEYPVDSAFALRWQESGRKELPWLEMLEDTEFYTSVRGIVLCHMAGALADACSFEDFEQFDKKVYDALRPEWMDA